MTDVETSPTRPIESASEFSVVKDDRVVARYSTREQCAAEILVRGWCVVERHGTWFVKGVEIRP